MNRKHLIDVRSDFVGLALCARFAGSISADEQVPDRTMTWSLRDEFGYKSVENRVSVPDLHATILHQLGLDHTKLTFTHSGRPERLTDPEITGARVVKELLT